ncbi:MAG: type II toxin-antitoxin system Phd/YefM family antitoxin [Pseudomonas sp.]
MALKSLGLEQARASLPSLAAQANAGKASIITRHGKPYAAIVPLAAIPASRGNPRAFLDLEGSAAGLGLWSEDVAGYIGALREEWD